VRDGGAWLSSELSSCDACTTALDAAQDGESSTTVLSQREREVLTLLAGGLSSREIAAALRVSPRTVDTHRVRVMKKLGLHKAPQLVRFAIRAGLITP